MQARIMWFGRYLFRFLNRPGQTDTGNIRISGEAPVIMSSALAQSAQGSVKGHQRGDDHIRVCQCAGFVRFGYIPETGHQHFCTGQKPKFEKAAVCNSRQRYADAGFRQIFDQARRRRFGTDVPIKRDGLTRFDQAGQGRGRASESKIAARAIELADKGIASPSILFT